LTLQSPTSLHSAVAEAHNMYEEEMEIPLTGERSRFQWG